MRIMEARGRTNKRVKKGQNVMNIRPISIVKAPKWAPLSSFYKDVIELRDETDEKGDTMEDDRRGVIGEAEAGRGRWKIYYVIKYGTLGVFWHIMNIALNYEYT